MMNSFFGIMLATGLIIGMASGKGTELIDAMINAAGSSVTLCIEICGAYMFWMGIMEVAKELGVIEGLAKIMRPILKRLFRGKDSENAIAPITLNLAANFFGLGSAATPFGIEAMKQMQLNNPKKTVATNNMCMFIAINASALELLPTTVLAMRTAAGSNDVYSVVVPTFIASVASFVSAIIICKLLSRVFTKESI